MRALRIGGTLCLVALLAVPLVLVWGRSGLGEWFWMLAIGHDLEGYPNLMDVDVVVFTLVSLLVSSAIVRLILPVEAWRTQVLRIVGESCVVGLLAQALGLTWYRSGLGDRVRVLAIGHGLESHPGSADVDVMVVGLGAVLISAAIVRSILRWRRVASAAHDRNSMPTD